MARPNRAGSRMKCDERSCPVWLPDDGPARCAYHRVETVGNLRVTRCICGLDIVAGMTDAALRAAMERHQTTPEHQALRLASGWDPEPTAEASQPVDVSESAARASAPAPSEGRE